MISLFALVLVLVGDLILIATLVPLRRLIRRLPAGSVRSRWYVMAALIGLFIVGYLGYAIAFRASHATLVDLIVPFVFFSGACFVLLATTLSLQTAMDVMRISALQRDAATDPLTGAFNRRYLDRRLKEEVASARRYGQPLAIFMLDIDDFKLINDRHGHQVGDEVLVNVARTAAAELREADVLTRYGGEEFLVIAPHTGLLGATNLAERVRKRIEAHDFSLSDGAGGTRRIRVTVSLGVASLEDAPEGAEMLVHVADANLLRAKQGGRNRVVAGTSEIPVNTMAAR